MNSIDLIRIVGNISQSLMPIQLFISGLAYFIGISFIIIALIKLRSLATHHSQERGIVPLAFFLGGAVLLYLPSAIQMFANTTFGSTNLLQYTTYNPYDIYSSMTLLIRTAGLIWFVRGCILLVFSSEPGHEHGPKGLAFLFAGILAINFETTMSFLNNMLSSLEAVTLTFKSSQGY